MLILRRRSLIQLALAALPFSLLAQIPNPGSSDQGSKDPGPNTKPVRVPAGTDRSAKTCYWP